MKFYINTLTFKNTIQAEQVFYSKEYSKLISPAMIENIILQTEDKKNIIELPLKIIKFVKKGDSKKTALPLDSEEKDIGFIIGYSPKERTEYVSNQIKAAHYKFEDVRKIKVIFKDIESMMNTSFISKETNQSIISDGGVFEKMGLNIGMNEEAFEKLNLQLELSRKENEEIKGYIDHIDEKLKVSQTMIVEKEEVINVQQSRIDDLTIEKDKVIDKSNHLQLEYDKTKQLLIDKEKEAENLRNEYNQNKNNFNAETEKLKSQLNVALEEAKVLRGKLSEVEQENGKLKNDIIALNNQIATLKAEVEKLKLQLVESQKHLQNMTIERDNQKVRADQGDNQVSALKQELNKAIGEWEKFRKYSMEFEVQVQDLKKKYLAKQEEIKKYLALAKNELGRAQEGYKSCASSLGGPMPSLNSLFHHLCNTATHSINCMNTHIASLEKGIINDTIKNDIGLCCKIVYNINFGFNRTAYDLSTVKK